MDDDSNRPDYFQHRWGVKEWDVGATTIPNPILVYYARVPWTDKDGKYGRGITNQEMLCIIHLASFHYESEKGESRPAIGTVARRMGYKKEDSVRSLIKSLEHKNLLTVERRPGKCSIYDFSNLSRAILKLDQGQPPHPNGGLQPNGGLSDGGHSNGPHSQGDEEKKSSKEEKQGEEKKKEEEGDSTFPETDQTDSAAIPAQEGGDADDEIETGDPAGRGAGDHIADIGEVESPVLAHGADSVRGGDGRRIRAGADPVIESIADDFLNKPGPEDLARATADARAEAGGAWTAPPTAGGDDAAAEAALAVMYRALDSEPPRKGSDDWKEQIGIFSQVLRDRGVKGVAVAEKAGELMGAANLETPHFANPRLSSFPAAFGIYVGKAKKRADETPDRHDRYDTPNVRASQAAWKERQAARPPPVEDDKVGTAVKGELQLQMTKVTFETWVKPIGIVCDDGVLTVTAPDETVKGWLADRLATTIRRTAVGVVGAPVEVRFGVAGEPLAVGTEEVEG